MPAASDSPKEDAAFFFALGNCLVEAIGSIVVGAFRANDEKDFGSRRDSRVSPTPEVCGWSD